MLVPDSIEPITLIWVSTPERSNLSPDDINVVKGNDVRSETKANTCYDRHKNQWVKNYI